MIHYYEHGGLLIGERFDRRFKKPKPSGMIGEGKSISAQDRAGQTADYGKAQGTLDQFEGPVQNSPFYKALLTTGTDATSTAYDSAVSNSRSRAKGAGFGYNQPIAGTAEDQIRSREASDLGALPGKAAAEAAPLSLQAAGQTAGMGTALGSEGADYFKSVVPLESQYQDQLFQQQQALWNSLAQIPKDLTDISKLGAGA